MPWEKNSPRRAELPKDWAVIRQGVLERDGHRCQKPLTFGGVCGRPANEVDHRGSRYNHTPANLWALCHEHHAAKTHNESRHALRPKASRKRSPEAHPNKR